MTMPSEKISKWVTWFEMTRTSHAEFLEQNLEAAEALKETIIQTAKELADPIRELFGAAIIISSGFRDSVLNQYVKGAPGSRHLLGRAIDFNIAGMNTVLGRISVVEKISQSPIKFRRLLIEAETVHIDLPEGGTEDGTVSYAKPNPQIPGKWVLTSFTVPQA